jgi:outer membrane protein, heavy metal efflux system
MSRILILLIPLFFILNKVEAQTSVRVDTVSLTIQDAESLFLKNNFDLLAAKYQIGEADAAVIQSRLWDNPNLSVEKEAYNKPSNRWFNIPNTGEIAVSFQQLILLAGKKNKKINIEKFNSQIAQYQFYDLMRTLHFELRTTFFELYFLQQSLSVYDLELTALKSLVDTYAKEYQKGNVPFKELARLQALQFNLGNEKIDVLKSLTEKQGNLILLTGDSLMRPIKPIVNVSSFDDLDPSAFNISQLLEKGLINRYDLKISDVQVLTEQMDLSLQKAMRIPDLTIGVNYDRVGGYIPNYNSISMSFNLPFRNRNQGNIKASEYKVEEDKILKNQKELEVKNDITIAYAQFVETDRLYKSSLQKFNDSYNKLFYGISFACKNHTISLLEFIDYFETFKNSKNGYYQLQNNRIDAIENLNLATGINIFK